VRRDANSTTLVQQKDIFADTRDGNIYKIATIAAIILLMLPLLCCSKDKNLLPKQTNEESEQTKQGLEPTLEAQDFLCNEEQIAMYKDKASCEEAVRGQNKAGHEFYLHNENSLKELEARYKDIFKKTPPMCKECKECSIEERNNKIEICIYGLRYALNAGIPYPTLKENIVENENIKNAFKKRFVMPITNFELSIVRVYFANEGTDNINDILRVNVPNFSVVRTATGAYAKYYELETELSMLEWLDFIRNLYKLGVNKWEAFYHYDPCPPSEGFSCSSPPDDKWFLSIYSLDEDGYLNRLESSGINKYPPNWGEFMKVVNDMKAKIRKKAEVK